jgi:malate dehydrogenase (oxaloacetate-decarboxylating)
MKNSDIFSSSQRTFEPKMTLQDLVLRDPELVKEALKAFRGGGVWMSGTTVDVTGLEKAAGRGFSDILYTPGVSAPSLKLSDLHLLAQKKNTPKAWETFWKAVDEYTPKFHRVAIISDGTRVLGMGDIGPFAGQEVMYGKSLIFGLLGGLYGEAHVLTLTDPREIVKFALNGQATWGGINLEDIASPKCFEVLDELKRRAEVAVWHDDQQGAAAVVLAGLLNALRVVGKKIGEVKIVFVGFGAANTKTFEYLNVAGANPERCLCLDSKGVIHLKRTDIDWKVYPNKKLAAEKTKASPVGGLSDVFKKADVVVAFSQPGAFGLEDVAKMADKAIVFACANPIPEIDPLKAARLENVAVVGTGRPDFPNQVNNSLFFPGGMAGVLAVGGKSISDGMVVAGAKALAGRVANPLSERILPQMTLENMVEISPLIAKSVAEAAMKDGVARFRKSLDQVYDEVKGRILRNQKRVVALTKAGLLK